MLYAWIGFLKDGAQAVPQQVQHETTDFLAQPLIKIHLAGPLRDSAGERAAMMIIFEHDSRESAELFVRDSPYLRAGLYDDHNLYEYGNEVGSD
ncbi:MAG TPA: hypothetical protein VM145_06840 [Sphingomicrobium sp.]|nr:hypothetical protein [Sphingomicrobium sp.]